MVGKILTSSSMTAQDMDESSEVNVKFQPPYIDLRSIVAE
jgi:hypothetical protein